MTNPRGSAKGGVQSVEIGVAILSHLIYAGEAMSLTALAQAHDMPRAKVHRYLRSCVRGGLVIQNKRTRKYDLGPLAFTLGALALKRHGIPAACDRLSDLRASTGQSTSVVIWGAHGPIVARYELASEAAKRLIPLGEMPVTKSASGRLFAALLPESMTLPLVAGELTSAQAPTFKQMLSETRVRRMARQTDLVMKGVSSLSAPLVASDGSVAAAVCVLGPSSDFDTSWQSKAAKELAQFVDTINFEMRNVAMARGNHASS